MKTGNIWADVGSALASAGLAHGSKYLYNRFSKSNSKSGGSVNIPTSTFIRMPRGSRKRKRGRPAPARRAPRRKSNMSVVTQQRDFVSSTGTMTKGKGRRGYARSRAAKRKYRQWQKKVKKAVAPPRTAIKFYTSITRSWVSNTDESANAILPLCAYRGDGSVSSSTTTAGVGAIDYNIRLDDFDSIFAAFRSFEFQNLNTPSGGPVATKNQEDWWFNIVKCHIDVTLTNQGFLGTEPAVDASDNNIEYEIWKFWPKAKTWNVDEDFSMNNPDDWDVITRNGQSEPPNNAFTQMGPDDPQYMPFLVGNGAAFFNFKEVGRGYLPLGESVRFRETFKPQGYISNRRYTEESNSSALANKPWKRGKSAAFFVTWRGTARPGTDSSYSRTRLAFQINKFWRVTTSNTNWDPGFYDCYLDANSFN